MIKPKPKTKRTPKLQITKSKSINNCKLKSKVKPKPTSRSKSKIKTLSNSMNVSKKNLHIQTLNYQTGRKLVKSDSKGLIGKLHLLRWCTQTDRKLKPIQSTQKITLQTKQNLAKDQLQDFTVKSNRLDSRKSSNQNLQNILYYFSKQIQNQNQLRFIKHFINNSNFNDLSKQLSKHNINLYQLQLQLDEYDPLFTPEQINNLDKQLIKQINICNQYWHNNIQRKFSKHQVINLFQKIDCNMNGLIDLKSFTRELGNLMSKALRKKDTLRIFRRLENNNEISLSTLIRELCRKQNVD